MSYRPTNQKLHCKPNSSSFSFGRPSCSMVDVGSSFGLMVSNGRLVHYLRPSGHQLNPEGASNTRLNSMNYFSELTPIHSDINMILSLSYCKSYSPYERWMPLCLPHFNSTGTCNLSQPIRFHRFSCLQRFPGYLFAYIGYVMPSLCILFLSTEKDTKTFHRFSTARGLIKKVSVF